MRIHALKAKLIQYEIKITNFRLSCNVVRKNSAFENLKNLEPNQIGYSAKFLEVIKTSDSHIEKLLKTNNRLESFNRVLRERIKFDDTNAEHQVEKMREEELVELKTCHGGSYDSSYFTIRPEWLRNQSHFVNSVDTFNKSQSGIGKTLHQDSSVTVCISDGNKSVNIESRQVAGEALLLFDLFGFNSQQRKDYKQQVLKRIRLVHPSAELIVKNES
ncbi:MAG: hypothetical protein NZO16_01475 [Deltaproteobacteria bacterium]|nr:hypothetical protein [Deltaproteobacteria bacterium]